MAAPVEPLKISWDLSQKHVRHSFASGYLVGRRDAGDERLEVADAEGFGDFYVAKDGGWHNVDRLYEEFVGSLSEEDAS